MHAERIYVGGWFQRTNLHLSEIYGFLSSADSPLNLDKSRLKKLHCALLLKEVKLEVGNLEYIHIETSNGVEVKIYEDGLMLLGKDAAAAVQDIRGTIDSLTSYYETKLSPAFGYLFSLGAPIPKELANIKNIYPYFVVLRHEKAENVQELLTAFKQKKYFDILTPSFDIYRGNELYIIDRKNEPLKHIERFIEEQIFIREFKGQLHHYLNLHRLIWEKIAVVKEKGEIRGKEVSPLNTQIQSYAKTINLIEARINQMSVYLKTRESVARNDPNMHKFLGVLQFKHETLGDTLEYVKEIWKMTKNYVESAVALFSEIQAKSTEASVKNLAIITSVGVGATLIGLFAQPVPKFTQFGIFYFIILVTVGWAANHVIREISKRRMYKIEDTKIAKDIS